MEHVLDLFSLPTWRASKVSRSVSGFYSQICSFMQYLTSYSGRFYKTQIKLTFPKPATNIQLPSNYSSKFYIPGAQY